MRSANSSGRVSDYKTAVREAIEAGGTCQASGGSTPVTIIANVGDQQSDLVGLHSERTFKLPNPFYFIP
jgi:acid phosphatase